MKITKKILENLIEDEIRKLMLEYESDTLRHGPDYRLGSKKGPVGGDIKTARSGIAAEGHLEVLEEILDRLSRIEGKIDILSGQPGMSTPS